MIWNYYRETSRHESRLGQNMRKKAAETFQLNAFYFLFSCLLNSSLEFFTAKVLKLGVVSEKCCTENQMSDDKD